MRINRRLAIEILISSACLLQQSFAGESRCSYQGTSLPKELPELPTMPVYDQANTGLCYAAAIAGAFEQYFQRNAPNGTNVLAISAIAIGAADRATRDLSKQKHPMHLDGGDPYKIVPRILDGQIALFSRANLEQKFYLPVCNMMKDYLKCSDTIPCVQASGALSTNLQPLREELLKICTPGEADAILAAAKAAKADPTESAWNGLLQCNGLRRLQYPLPGRMNLSKQYPVRAEAEKMIDLGLSRGQAILGSFAPKLMHWTGPLGHVMLVVGCRIIDGKKQYLLRNSWGPDCSNNSGCDGRGNQWFDADDIYAKRNITNLIILE